MKKGEGNGGEVRWIKGGREGQGRAGKGRDVG